MLGYVAYYLKKAWVKYPDGKVLPAMVETNEWDALDNEGTPINVYKVRGRVIPIYDYLGIDHQRIESRKGQMCDSLDDY